MDQLSLHREGPVRGEGGPVAVVDFVVQGCTVRTQDRCAGAVPLVLAFSAVVEAQPLSAKWDFGDGSPGQTGMAVSHTYGKVGTYTVSLAIGGSGGTVSEQKTDFVVVDPVGPGGPCPSDSACASGTCVCQDGCPFPLSGGFCLEGCTGAACYSVATVCVDLSTNVPDVQEPWRGKVCLPACSSDVDCTRPGFSCRVAPGPSGWQRVCLPPFPRVVGAPCRKGTGATDASLCLGDLCLDMGASGYCTAACGPTACPEGSRCAQFTGENQATVCLAHCAPGLCAGDPLLGCELPSTQGYFGFQVIGPPDPPGTRYCAAKHCSTDGDCGLLGRCDQDKGGFCVPGE
jgi:PKD repeat protein